MPTEPVAQIGPIQQNVRADKFQDRCHHIQDVTPCFDLIDIVLSTAISEGLPLGPIQLVRHTPVRTNAGTSTFRFVQSNCRRSAADSKRLDVTRYHGLKDQFEQVGIDEADGIIQSLARR